MRLKGKVAVVLGAAAKDNMGQVTARQFAQEGAKVIIAGRRREPLEEFAKEIGAEIAVADITKKADLEALRDAAVAAYGAVNIAVNFTGNGLLAPLLETTEEQIDMIMDLHFKGVYFFLQVFAGHMAENGGGSIIQTSSATTYCPIDNHAAYIGTKAGADSLVRCFAKEFGPGGVKVNSILPGLTATPMAADAVNTPGLEAAFVKEYPLGRIGTADDVAHSCVFLASDESFMTGQMIQVNGGLTLRRNPTSDEIGASVGAAMAASQ